MHRYFVLIHTYLDNVTQFATEVVVRSVVKPQGTNTFNNISLPSKTIPLTPYNLSLVWMNLDISILATSNMDRMV
jgi:hypothetical protein